MAFPSPIFLITSFFFFLIFFNKPTTVNGSLFPLSYSLDDLFSLSQIPDPFKILEHLPIGLQKDQLLVNSPPRVDWKESPQGHIITLDVPGYRKNELKIEAIEENHELRVTGERSDREEEEGEEDKVQWHCSERSDRGKFVRQFRLSRDADLESVNAKLEDGVLRVLVGKLSPEEAKRPKVIPVTVLDEHQGSSKESLSPVAKDEL